MNTTGPLIMRVSAFGQVPVLFYCFFFFLMLKKQMNLDNHDTTRNAKKAWKIKVFLYIGEHTQNENHSSPKR